MKTKFTLLFSMLMIGSAVILSSCGKDDDPSTGGGGGDNTPIETISFEIDGAAFDLGSFTQDFESSTGYLSLLASSNNQTTQLSIVLSTNDGDNLTVGNISEVSIALQEGSNAEQLFEGKSGSITLTKNNKSGKIIEGTFTATLSNENANPTTVETRQITNGKFYATY